MSSNPEFQDGAIRLVNPLPAVGEPDSAISTYETRMSLVFVVVAGPLTCALPFPLLIKEASTAVILAYSATTISFQVLPENFTVTVFDPALMLGATKIDTTLPLLELAGEPAANE